MMYWATIMVISAILGFTLPESALAFMLAVAFVISGDPVSFLGFIWFGNYWARNKP